MKAILYTDGACSGNPGPGGWAALLIWGERERLLSGAERETTNNRMELTAVIEGLRAFNRPTAVAVHTDSAYVANAFKQGWLERWRRNGWQTANKRPVENQDLWKALLREVERHTVEFQKVKGHANDERNNRVDRAAVEAIKQL